MKVGVISRGSPDYLIDIVTDGLIRLLGRQSVSVDYNIRHEVNSSGPYQHLCRGLNGPEPFPIEEADVLVASRRSMEALRRWIKQTGKGKVALIDGEDHDQIDVAAAGLVSVYFKREYFHFRPYPPNVRPLSFGAIPEEVPHHTVVDRKVFYSWHDTHPFRKEIAGVLSSMGFPPAPNEDKRDYNKRLARSLVGVSVRGNGWDTYRYWEIPYFGAALLAQRSPQVINGDFMEGVEAVYFSDADELRRLLKTMLDSPENTEAIGRAGRKAVLAKHLSRHRAQQVLEGVA